MRNFDDFIGFDKEAAPRWRKEWGNLSEASQNRLRKSVASQANETAKRLRGIDAVSKKFNVKYQSSTPELKRLPVVGKKFPGIRDNVNLFREVLDDMVPARTSTKGNVVTNVLASNKAKALKGSGIQAFSQLGGADLQKMKYTNRPLYDEISSIIGHHEMIGEAMTAKRKKKVTGVLGNMKNQLRGGTYFSHFSPEVLHRESATVATASPEAKKFFENLRSTQDDVHNKSLAAKVYAKKGKRIPSAHTEISELKNIGGIEYGKDAVVDTKKMKAHREAYRKAENILFRNHHKLG